MAVTWRPHQLEAIENLGNGKVLWGGTGSGKTLTALGYYVEKEVPLAKAAGKEDPDIVVITTAKKRDDLDWEHEALKLRISRDRDLSGYGSITVDSWNNIKKYKDLEDCFFIFDEQRLVGTGEWVRAFHTIAKKNRWILLSATPGDTWLDYAPVFVANGFFRNITQFKQEHVVYEPYVKFPLVKGYLKEDVLSNYRNWLLVEMPYERHTTRHAKLIQVEFDKELFVKTLRDRWNPFEERPIYNVSELFAVLRKIIGTDPSRINKIRKLLKKHPKMVIFYNFDFELDILRTLAKDTTVAEWNGHKHQPIPDTDSWAYLVQYQSGSEGWNCTATDAMAFYTLTYSFKQFSQAQGRIDRMDTPFIDLFYYMLISDSMLEAAQRRSLGDKETFNQAKYARDELGITPGYFKEDPDGT